MLWVVVGVILAGVLAVGWWFIRQPISLTLCGRMQDLSGSLEIKLDYTMIHQRQCWSLPAQPSGNLPTKPDRFKISVRRINRVLWSLRKFEHIVDALWHHMQVTKFDFYCQVGLGDAAQTALWSGRLTELLAWWINVHIAPRAMPPPLFAVDSVWDRRVWACNFTSIIQLRPSDIILAVASGFAHRKGGRVKDGNAGVGV